MATRARSTRGRRERIRKLMARDDNAFDRKADARAAKLIEACRAALACLEDDVAADCRWCSGEGGWTNKKPHQMTPVIHKPGCPILLCRAAIGNSPDL